MCSPLSNCDLKGFCRVQGGTDQEQQGLLSNSLSVKQLCPFNPVRCLLVNTIKLSIMCVNSYLIASQMCEIYVF